MSDAYFIVPERLVEGLDTFVDGKALAHCRPLDAKRSHGGRHLESLAQAGGVRPLLDFFSESPTDVRALLSEEGEPGEVEKPPEVELPPEQWFPAAEGLATVRGLLTYLTDHPDAAADVDPLIDDLRQFEEVLTALDAAGVRWHLAVDS